MADLEGTVIVAGSINVDLIVGVDRLPVPGETVNGHRFVQQGGGKSANQAVAASRVGADVTLIGAVGGDDLGTAALVALADEGVRTDACRTIEGDHTGLALIIVDDAGENQIAVAPGANARVDAAMVRETLAALKPSASTVVLVSLEFGDDAVEAILEWAVRWHLRAIVNPAPARPLSDAILAARPILTPNATEAAMLSGSDDVEAAGRILSERSGAAVIVSLGAAGALLWSDDSVSHLPAFSVEPVDTTGAGDALNGILAAGLARGVPLGAALRWAVAGAALSTMQVGARAGLPTQAAVERFAGPAQVRAARDEPVGRL
ncbi:MAG: ribokinase [Chloroflexota bacterium]